MTRSPSRANLSHASWDELFDFLDPSRPSKVGPERDALAGARCQDIRRRLECYFAARCCPEAEDLAIETLLRVAGKCRDVDRAGFSDPTGYFYGVARNVLHEWQRHASADEAGRQSLSTEVLHVPQPGDDAWQDSEFVHRCLDQCLAQLGGPAGSLLLSYYSAAGAAKVAHHRALAEKAGKSVNSLRIEVHRLRKTIRDCLFRRLGNVPPPSDI